MESNNTLQIGTTGGTLLSIVPNIISEDIVKTVILAMVGAIVSFSVSLLLKWFAEPRKK